MRISSNSLIWVLPFLVIITLASCKSEKQSSYERISGLRDSLFDSTTGMVNIDVASRLLEESMKYASSYPDDTASLGMMLRSKDYALYVNDPVRSVKIMESILKDYPDADKNGVVLFTLAFVYENYLGELEKARERYEMFVERFPDSGKLSEDARFALKNLGKTAEEILSELEVAGDTVMVSE